MKRSGLFHTLIPFVILLTVSVLAGALLLTLAYYIPVDQEKKTTAFETLWSQNSSADYPTLSAGEQYFTSYRPGVFDGGTVMGIITDNAYRSVGDNKLVEAMIPSYSYYWHGYVIFLRPLLYLFEYKDLEIYLSFLLLLLAILICVSIGRQKGTSYTLLFFTSFVLLMPMIVGVCLQYIPVVFLSYFAVLFLLYKREWLAQNNRLYLFFMLTGILTSYFDLLTFPLYTWGIPVLWWVLLDKSDTGHVRKVIFSAFSWCSGYAGMWAGKWLIGTIILRVNVFSAALESILSRSGYGFSLRDRYYSIYKNWRHYSYQGYALIMLVWLVIWLYHTFRKGWKNSSRRYALGLIFLSSFAWYAVCAQHTDIHHFFTYRIFGVMVSAGMALMLESMQTDSPVAKTGRYGVKAMLLPLLSSLAAALVIVCFPCEETEVSNKTIPCWLDDYYVDSVQMEMDYTPVQGRIFGICVAAYTESTEGYYSLKLLDQGEIVYEEKIPVSFMGDRNYALYPVDWHVQKGKTYRLAMESVDIEVPIQLYISDYDMADYSEIGPLTLNGELLNAKTCFGEIYWARPFSRNRKLFLFGTWFTIFMLGWYVLGADLPHRNGLPRSFGRNCDKNLP